MLARRRSAKFFPPALVPHPSRKARSQVQRCAGRWPVALQCAVLRFDARAPVSVCVLPCAARPLRPEPGPTCCVSMMQTRVLAALFLVAGLLVASVRGNLDSPSPSAVSTPPLEPAPAPASTSSPLISTRPPNLKQGTCCKSKNTATGECDSIATSNLALWLSHTPGGSDTWCGVQECGCGGTNMCVNGAENCGYNNPATDRLIDSCICASECLSRPEYAAICCSDFTQVCPITATTAGTGPAPQDPTTTTKLRLTTTTRAGATTTRQPTLPTSTVLPTTDPNITNTIDAVDNIAVIVSSVTVVVVVVVVVLVILAVKVCDDALCTITTNLCCEGRGRGDCVGVGKSCNSE